MKNLFFFVLENMFLKNLQQSPYLDCFQAVSMFTLMFSYAELHAIFSLT